MVTTVVPPPPTPPPSSGQGQSGGNPLPPPDWRKSAIDLAADSSKQLITVATGVITATVIFSKDLNMNFGGRVLAAVSWVVLIISVLCGLFTLLNISGQLEDCANKSLNPTLTERGFRFFSKGQLGFFVGGIAVTILFGLFAKTEKKPETPPVVVNCPAAQVTVVPPPCPGPPPDGHCRKPDGPILEK
jgi:hypothetical protein